MVRGWPVGKNPSGDVYEISAPARAGRLAGVLLEVFPDKSLPNQSLGRGSNGNFVLTGVQVAVHPPKGKPVVLNLNSAKSDYDQANWEVIKVLKNAQNLNKAGSSGWAINGNEKNKPSKAMFLAADAVEVPKGAKLVGPSITSPSTGITTWDDSVFPIRRTRGLPWRASRVIRRKYLLFWPRLTRL